MPSNGAHFGTEFMQNLMTLKSLIVLCLFGLITAGCGGEDNADANVDEGDDISSESVAGVQSEPARPLSEDGKKLKQIMLDWTKEMYDVVKDVKTPEDAEAAGEKVGASVDRMLATLKDADITMTPSLMPEVENDPELTAWSEKMSGMMQSIKTDYPEASDKLEAISRDHIMRMAVGFGELSQQSMSQEGNAEGQ